MRHITQKIQGFMSSMAGVMTLVVAALLVGSCSQDFNESVATERTQTVEKSFTVSQEEGPTSRTYLDENLNVLWYNGDKLGVVCDNHASSTAVHDFTVSDGAGKKKANISGEECSGASKFLAVYPYSIASDAATKWDVAGKKVTVAIPTAQTATAGSFDPNSAIMAAWTEGTHLGLKNACSYIQITADRDYKSLTLSAGQAIAGTCDVALADNSTTVSGSPAEKSIVLTPASGNIEKGKSYIFCVYPQSISGTLKLAGTGADNKSYEGTFNIAGNFQLQRASKYTVSFNMKEATSSDEYVVIDGVNWATKNLGATTIAESYETCSGDFYAWAAVKTTWNEGYSLDNAPYYNTSSISYEKYYSGDTNRILVDVDDVVKSKDSNWRMPTQEECKKLVNACWPAGDKVEILTEALYKSGAKGVYWNDCTWTSGDGNPYKVNGMLFVADATHKVFFPAAGYADGKSSSAQGVGVNALCWSSTVVTNYYNNAYCLTLGSGTCDAGQNLRYQGCPIRPVYAK